MLLFVPRLARAMGATQVTHVFTAAYWSFLLVAGWTVILGRILNRPVIINYHSGEADDHLQRHPTMTHQVLKRSQRLVVPSKYLAGVFKKHGYPSLQVPNLIDLSRFKTSRRECPYVRFLCTRSFEPCYDIPTALRAFKLVSSYEPRARLTLVGGGSQTDLIRDLIAQLGLEERVEVVGAVSHSDMPSFYEAADIYLNPPLVDNQPLSVLEAIASGVFVISTDVGGVKDLIAHAKSGLLVPAQSPEAMAHAACRVIRDEKLFISATALARRVLSDHDPATVSRLWLQCYASVCRWGPGSAVEPDAQLS
jgi:glycosyltransferase involved in cell wall biosynthesis